MGGEEKNATPQRSGATEIKRRERHAGEAGHSANPREARPRHGVSVRTPLLRCSVSIRCLRPTPLPFVISGRPRPLFFLPIDQSRQANTLGAGGWELT